MADRTRARQLAAEYLAKGDPTGWFEQLYREAGEGRSVVPWADRHPNSGLVEFSLAHPLNPAGKSALAVGCGYGDDAEQLAAWGFQTTAFDVSSSAIAECRKRYPSTAVNYVAADLLNPPAEWDSRFDFVFEANTIQVLPPDLRKRAIHRLVWMVKPGGNLLVIARARDEGDPEGQMPWPLTRPEFDEFPKYGAKEVSFEDYLDGEAPPVRRFRVFYERSA